MRTVQSWTCELGYGADTMFHRTYFYLLLLFFMPQYTVPEDLEITNKEKLNYNGCNGLAGSERVLK